MLGTQPLGEKQKLRAGLGAGWAGCWPLRGSLGMDIWCPVCSGHIDPFEFGKASGAGTARAAEVAIEVLLAAG